MGNWGSKVSRAGYPVDTAADNQLLFTTSFPTLLTYNVFTLAANSSTSHGLSYAPVCWAISQEGSVAGTQITGFGDAVIKADTTTIYNTNGQTNIVYVFARDIRTNYTAPTINTTPATQSSINQDYGFKASANGYDASSAALAHLIAFSGASLAGQAVRQVLIHKTGFQDNVSDNQTVNFAHGLGYTPMYLAYRRNHGDTPYFFDYYISGASYNSPNTFQVSADGTNISFILNGCGAQDVAYVVFKDPF